MLPIGRRSARVILTAVLLGTMPAPLNGQNAFSRLVGEVRSATAAGNHTTALAKADSLVARAPDHPGAVLVRAVALAATGRDADAAESVRRLLRRDPRYARTALRDSTLARVRPLLDDVNVDSMAERADWPIAQGHAWTVLQERDLVLEGTAWDPATGRLLLGSLNKHKVVAVDTSGVARDLVPSGAHGLRSVVGIHVDSVRGTLWVASTPRYDTPTDTTSPAVFAFDAATGAFRRRIPGPSGASFLNDLTTGPDGTVYLTDSRGAHVLVLPPAAETLGTYDPVGPLTAPNGITMSSDGTHLFVSDLDHVQVVSLATGQSWRLLAPDSVDMSGIDGLAFAGGALIAHHPLAFWRIARYALDSAFRRARSVAFIEWNTPDARTSTTGEVVDDDYYYIGNGQIDRMNAGTIDSATMEPIRLYRAPVRQAPGGAVAVALSGVDSVVLFDPQSMERLGALPVGREPHEIAAGRDGRSLYVADAGDSSITVIETAPAPRVRATWRLPDGIRVHDVALAADGAVWAASGEPALVLELDPVTGAVRRRYTLQRAGSWMLDARGPLGALTVANLDGGAVTLVDPASGRETIFASDTGEIDAAATPDLSEIWSVNAQTGTLSMFDARTGRLIARRQSGAGASRIVFSPDAQTALVVHTGDSTLVAYDVPSGSRRDSVTLPGGPKVLALSADGRRAYVTHPRGALTMIDVAAMRVLRTIPLAGTPDGVALAEPRRAPRHR
jgi:DNA-binding beta-propeller fold protein YncE